MSNRFNRKAQKECDSWCREELCLKHGCMAVYEPPTIPLTKRERRYLERLHARCRTLRARVGEGIDNLNYVNEWAMELHAIEWAISKIDPDSTRAPNA